MERKQGVKLHDCKVIVENEPKREHPDIERAAHKVGDELDETGDEQPTNVRNRNVPARQRIVRRTTLFKGGEHSDKDRAGEERQGIEDFIDHGERNVGVAAPDVALSKERTKVRTPCVAGPAQNLFEEAPIVLECREQFGLFAALCIGVPAVRHHPTREELVVSRVERIFAEPQIVGEAVLESRIFQDEGAVGGGATGETADAAVNVGRGRNLDIATRQAEASENLPEGLVAIGIDSVDGLGGADTAHLEVLEAGEDVLEHSGLPNGIVVGKHQDLCGGRIDALDHLKALVGFRDSAHPDALWIDFIGKLLKRAAHVGLGNNNDLFGFAGQPAASGDLKLFTGINRGHDNRHILLGSIGWVGFGATRLVDEPCNDADKVPQVPIKANHSQREEEREHTQVIGEVKHPVSELGSMK